ncbi:tRNA_anti-like [Filimonas lacunae]|uniref:tRNA_anti-like n=1 Tax=Filimonas lacunae TaxID=477680 RepID=A0A173MFX0_9BACT|nr:hypothetical protein [Filimonas lacunae]BAV06493.1 hypothetical protein FLA_2512 [Filimonas lacunae]SIT27155.1 tRNA_anti-like [Filimonas lacunae]
MSRAQQPKKPDHIRWILYVALLFVAAFCVRWITNRKPAEPDVIAANKALDPNAKTIQATDLYSQYTNNESKADDTFKGETILITGKIVTIDNGGGYIVLAGKEPYGSMGIQCMFDDENTVSRLSKLQTVTVEGRVRGRKINVIVKDCVVKSTAL